METITNVVNTVSGTVSKAIYGEQPANGNETAGNEPVSGVQGQGTATDPYDKGNSEDPTNPTTRNETAGSEPVSGLQGKGTVTEPFDQGNSADATNTTSLPIREKSALDNTANIPDLSAKPTIPTTDAFNSAAAANASTAAQPSAITSQETSTTGETLSQGDADAAHTKNLAATLSETDAPTSSSSEPKILDTTPNTDGPKTPGLAGFGDKPSISPSDQSQQPTIVSDVASSSTDTQALGAGDASASHTQNLSETLAKTEGSTDTSGKHDAPFVSDQSANAQQAATPSAAPVEVGSTTGATTEDAATKKSASKEADRVLESTHKDETSGTAATASHTKSESPSGEKEKVSKMEKLKEKLHIGHKH